MEFEDFEARLDEFGPDIEDWPADLRNAARLLLARSAEARDLLDDELRIASAFAIQPKPRAPSGLADRIVLRAMTLDPPVAAPVAAPVAVAARPIHAEAKAPPLGMRLRQWLEDVLVQPRYRYAFGLAACFVIGIAGSQVVDRGQTTSSSLYVSGIYADLAY